LIKANVTKKAYVATGAAIAFLIDDSRLAVYSRWILQASDNFDFALLSAVVAAALAGSLLGNRYLHKATMGSIQRLVALMLFVVAARLISGLL
jgi:uncharacterized membrane protein YfcA